jgi:hypothetical protein
VHQQVLACLPHELGPIKRLVSQHDDETTGYFRDVVRQKHPGIEAAWILRVVAEPLEERRQIDGRFALWGLVPEAQNRVLRVITLDDRETIHNAFFDQGFLRARTRSLPCSPAAPPAP